MITALIIDDEESTITVLKLLLQQYVPGVTAIHTAIGAKAGLDALAGVKPDLLFLDIEMPFMTGFELLEKFSQNSFEIIFVTAFSQYAIKAIRYSALDYLLKPVDANELKEAVKRFIERRDHKIAHDHSLYQNLLYNLHQAYLADYRLAIATTKGTFFLNASEIIRCEAISNYTRFYIAGKKPVVSSKTLKEYEDLLKEQQFLRVHRAHLVNPAFIASYKEQELHLKDGSAVPVSRRKWDTIKEQLS